MSQSESQSPLASSIPDKITAIRAWRAWALRDDGRLFSLNAGLGNARYLWPIDRPLEALCLATGHDAPQESCTCGIYAHKDREWIIKSTMGMGHVVGSIGIVKLSGRVIEAEKGYRAQYAEPEMLAVMEDQPTLSVDGRTTGPLMGYAGGVTGRMTTAFWLSASSVMMPQIIGFTMPPSPPIQPSNLGAIRRSRGQCELCGEPLNKSGKPIPAGKDALCAKCLTPPEPEPAPAAEPEMETHPFRSDDRELTGIVALVAKNYPKCVVVPYSKLRRAG